MRLREGIPALPLLIALALSCADSRSAEAQPAAVSEHAKPSAQENKKQWAGVDETVVEKFARDAGRPPREPFINTDKGDLLLFCFLLAGAISGFIAGYYFRALFPPRVGRASVPAEEPSCAGGQGRPPHSENSHV
jgi:hypothetical protein